MDLLQQRPAETGGVASAIALLIAYFAGVKEPGVVLAIGVVVGFIPAAITWLVTTIRGGKLSGERGYTRLQALVWLGAIGVAVAVVLALIPGGSNGPQTKTVTLGGPGHEKIALTPQAQAQVRQQAKEDAAGQDTKAESDLHDTTQPTPSELERARAVAPAGSPAIPQSPTFASPSTAGCKDAFVRNYSNRPAGARVLIGVLHWTGSRPIPHSTQDDLAIVRWFDTPAAQASSNYITDDDGHCYYVVPETKKAWTQAAANPWAVSDEHVNIGSLPVYPTAAGRAAVVRLMRGWHHRWKIPYRHGAVNQSTCVPTRSGFLAHRDLGPCGGGHPDIGIPSAVDSLIAQAKAADNNPKPSTIRYTAHEARTIHLIESVRRRPSTAARRRAISRYRATLLHYRANLRAAAKVSGWDRADRRRRYAGLLVVYKG